jgi:quercetin dioxygenase-like cupin family protein
MKRFLLFGALVLAVLPLAGADTHEATADKADPMMGIHRPKETKWTDAPPSIPKGAKVAILEGNPAQDGLFTMRIWLPDGYTVPPHFHSQIEHVTVVSGTFNLGFGETLDKTKGEKLPAGSFVFMKPGMRHYAWANGTTVIQVHGMGPWTITYVNAADDPRNVAKS